MDFDMGEECFYWVIVEVGIRDFIVVVICVLCLLGY